MGKWQSALALLGTAFAFGAMAAPGTSIQREVALPPGSGPLWAADSPRVLENGWIIVVDRGFDVPGPPAIPDAGAFHVFEPDGTHRLTRAGRSPGEELALFLLGGTRAAVYSRGWRNADGEAVGALMLVDLAEPLPDAITPDNAIVGTRAGDLDSLSIAPVGNDGLVIGAPRWDRGSLVDAGAARWVAIDGSTVGAINADNALVGRQAGDRVGHVVASVGDSDWIAFWEWRDGGVFESAAITHVAGTGAFVGEVSAANSLYGASPADRIGSGGLVRLPDGSLLVLSPDHDGPGTGNSGAITRFEPGVVRVGPIGPDNSLLGRSLDRLGSSGSVTVLADGHLVIAAPDANRSPQVQVGAVAFRRSDQALTGWIDPSNALYGSFPLDRIGSGGVRPLADGGYLVLSPDADLPGIVDAGAVTFGAAGIGVGGFVSAANSRVGRAVGDRVGSGGATVLVDGGAVILSPLWRSDAGIAGAGAATLIRGPVDVGPVDAGNSLVGATTGDFTGASVAALANGHYVVGTRAWDGLPDFRGAVTWGDGTQGATGAISAARSIVARPGIADVATIMSVVALDDGHYVIGAPGWRDAAGTAVGAAFWVDGNAAAAGAIDDHLGRATIGSVDAGQAGRMIHALPGGGHLVSSARLGTPDGVRSALTRIPPQPAAMTVVGIGNSLHGPLVTSGQPWWPVVGVRADGSWLSMERGYSRPGVSGWLGALSFGWADGATLGPITPANSIIGDRASTDMTLGAPIPVLAEDPARNTIISRRVSTARLVLLWPGLETTTRLVRLDGVAGSASVDAIVRVRSQGEAPVGRVEARDQRGRVRCATADGVVIGDGVVEYRCSVDTSATPAGTLAAEFFGYPRFAFSRSAALEAGQFLDGFER